jgi:hypothetical protein
VNLPENKPGRWGQGLTKDKMKDCVWLRPQLVVQIEFLEWTGRVTNLGAAAHPWVTSGSVNGPFLGEFERLNPALLGCRPQVRNTSSTSAPRGAAASARPHHPR